MYWRRKWQPTPVFLPGESQGRGSLVGCHLWGRTESDTTEVTQQQQQSISSRLFILLAYSIAQHSYHAHDNLGTLRRHATNLLCSPSKDMLHCIIQIYKWNEKDWLEPSGNRSREESERCRQPTAEWVLWGQCAYWGDPCMHLDNLMLTGKSPECFMYWLHSHEC